jgi:hypothetical protein
MPQGYIASCVLQASLCAALDVHVGLDWGRPSLSVAITASISQRVLLAMLAKRCAGKCHSFKCLQNIWPCAGILRFLFALKLVACKCMGVDTMIRPDCRTADEADHPRVRNDRHSIFSPSDVVEQEVQTASSLLSAAWD